MRQWINNLVLFALMVTAVFQLSGFIGESQLPQVQLIQENAVLSENSKLHSLAEQRELKTPLEIASLFAYEKIIPIPNVPASIVAEEVPVQVIENPHWLRFLGKVTVKNAESEYVFRNNRSNSVLNLTIGKEQAGLLLLSTEGGVYRLKTEETEIIIK